MWWLVVGIVAVLVVAAVAVRRRRRGTRSTDPAGLAHEQQRKTMGGYGEHL